jgi:hypothetical protein
MRTAVDAVTAGTAANEKVLSAISTADFTVAIVGDVPSPNVFFEAGVSAGSGKPLIVAATNPTTLPFDLRGVRTVAIEPHYLDPLFAAIDRLNIAPHAGSGRRPQGKHTPASTIAGFRKQLPEVDAVGFESLVVDAIASGGGDVVRSDSSSGPRFDFAVWSLGMEPVVPNPLVVEAKLRLPERLDSLRQQLLSSLSEAGLAWCMLIYRDGPQSSALADLRAPPILALRADELFDELSRQPFGDIVRKRRNLAVHGIAE